MTRAIRRRLRRLPPPERTTLLAEGLRRAHERAGHVQVMAADGTPMNPCARLRADQMVSRGRAEWVSDSPPTIRLVLRADQR